MVPSAFLTCLGLIPASQLVAGSPTVRRRDGNPHSQPSDEDLYLGGVEPDGVISLNAPIDVPPPRRFLSFAQLDGNEVQNGGENFDQMLNVTNAKETNGNDTYNLSISNTADIPAFSYKLVKRECPNQNVSFYRHSNGTYMYNTTLMTIVQDVNSVSQQPQKYRNALMTALNDTKDDYLRKIATTFALERAYENSSTPLGGPYERGPSEMTIFGVDAGGLNYSIAAIPPTTKVGNETPESMGTAILVYTGQAYDSLLQYCASDSNPLPTEQAIVAWTALDGLRSLQNLAVKTIKLWAEEQGGTLPAPAPRDRSVQQSLNDLLSGAISSVGDRFARVDNLQPPINNILMPLCAASG